MITARIVANAVAASPSVPNRMSARQMETAIDLAIGDDGEDMEWMLRTYGPTIRAELDDDAWRKLERRARAGMNARPADADASNDQLGAAAFLAGFAASRAIRENRRLGMDAATSAKAALRSMGSTLACLGALARNGGRMNGVSAITAYGAVQESFAALHRLVT